MASKTVIRPIIAGYDVILDQSEINRISIIIGVFILNMINKGHVFAPGKMDLRGEQMRYNITFARVSSYLHTNQMSCLYEIYIVQFQMSLNFLEGNASFELMACDICQFNKATKR